MYLYPETVGRTVAEQVACRQWAAVHLPEALGWAEEAEMKRWGEESARHWWGYIWRSWDGERNRRAYLELAKASRLATKSFEGLRPHLVILDEMTELEELED